MAITIPGSTTDGLEGLSIPGGISALSEAEAVGRATRFLGHLVEDTGFLSLEVLPLLAVAREARDWYVALQQDTGRAAGKDCCSLQVFVWPAGSWTRIHDHSSWGVFRCVAGEVVEERYERRDDGSVPERARLGMAWRRVWNAAGGTSTVLAYDGGIHRVGNPGRKLAISVHLYGPRIGPVDGRDYDLFRDYVCDRL